MTGRRLWRDRDEELGVLKVSGLCENYSPAIAKASHLSDKGSSHWWATSLCASSHRTRNGAVLEETTLSGRTATQLY